MHDACLCWLPVPNIIRLQPLASPDLAIDVQACKHFFVPKVVVSNIAIPCSDERSLLNLFLAKLQQFDPDVLVGMRPLPLSPPFQLKVLTSHNYRQGITFTTSI